MANSALSPPAVSACRFLSAGSALLATLALAQSLDFPALGAHLQARFGSAPLPRLLAWQKMLDDARDLPVPAQLSRVNAFFNSTLRFADDQAIWGKADYWATPMESLGQGQADCEDFSFAKYISLRDLAVPAEQLRLVYVQARLADRQQAHMVLAYYPSPVADPLILDNLTPQIRPASARADLHPVFSFNSDGVWEGDPRHPAGAPLSRWAELLRRTRADGFRDTP